MAINLTFATYEEMRSLPRIGHVTATHLIQVRDDCQLYGRPFNFMALSEKPYIKTTFRSLLLKGECYFEDKTGSPSYLDPGYSDIAVGEESQDDDGGKEQALSPEVDREQATAPSKPFQHPMFEDESLGEIPDKDGRKKQALSPEGDREQAMAPSISSQDEMLDILKTISGNMKSLQLTMQEICQRQDEFDNWMSSYEQLQATHLSKNPDVRSKMEVPYNPRQSSHELPAQSEERSSPVDCNFRHPDRQEAKPYVPKLKSYNGGECFRAWLTKFESFRRYYRWTDNDALFYLVGHLTDEPSEFYENLRPEVKNSYASTTEALIKMYEKKITPSTKRSELSSIYQKEDESIDAFSKRIKTLAYQAYPTSSDEMIEDQALQAFLRGCTDIYAAEIALIREPTTLDDAVQYTKVAVANHSLLEEKRPHRARHVSFKNEFSIRQGQQPGKAEHQDAFTEIIGMLRKLESKVTSNTLSS